MKRDVAILLTVVSVGVGISTATHAQGSFQNLDFESARLTPAQWGGYVPSMTSIPNWSAFIGDSQVSYVLHNNFTTGAASIDIMGPGFAFGNAVIEGQNTVALQSGIGPGGSLVAVTISQSGFVPLGSATLILKAWGNSFSVSFAGHDISLSPVGGGEHYVLYAGDISQFAGQTGVLAFSSLANAGNGEVYLDSIAFSAAAIPEPGTFALGLIGLGMLWGGKLFRIKK